jgi:acetyltransferase-like isoleucine patch superfamily enzyme
MAPEARLSVKVFLRGVLVLAAMVLTAPLWGLAGLQTVATGGESIFAAFSEMLSLVPGLAGIYLRRGFYCMCLEACAPDCHIGFGTTLAHRQVRIGRGVYIGNRCTLGQVIIEDYTAIGSNVDILSGRYQHHFDQLDTVILNQERSFRRIRIGCNCWIGNSAVIMDDIGPGSVIGAGSVVVKPIPAACVAVGNPAVVKHKIADCILRSANCRSSGNRQSAILNLQSASNRDDTSCVGS